MDDHTVAGRVTDIITVVSVRRDAALADIATLTGIPKPTVHRMAEDLTRRGVLMRTARGYRVGPVIAQWQQRGGAGREDDSTIHDALEHLCARFRGVAWWTDREDVLQPHPSLVHSPPALRQLVATAWPQPSDPAALTDTAMGHAVLAARPDLLEEIMPLSADPGARRRRAHLLDVLRRGADREAYLDDDDAGSGWRCVAVPAGGRRGGVIGVTVRVSPGSAAELMHEVQHAARILRG